ncbi:MAG: sulfurtransferase [Cyclobacteriaceae bacterium]
MRIGSILTIIILSITTAVAQQILVTPQWVNEHQSDPNLVILQVNRMKLDYESEHIPGARFLWNGWLAPNTPDGNMNAIDTKSAERTLRELGVNNDSKVVVCFFKDDVTVTARMFLMLEYFGLKGNVMWLDGGLEGWKKAGYAVSTETPEVKKGKFKVQVNPVLVDKDYVLHKLDAPSTTIVDARFKRFYDGEPVGYPRDGHIKGAKNIPYNEMVNDSNVFKSSDELSAYFTPVSPNKDNEIVMYCFIGQTASVVYLAGRVLGYPMKLYDGSMEEWSRIPNLPMETTPKTDEENKN